MIAVGTCAFLAGVFLVADAARNGHDALAARLRVRTLAVGAATGLVVFAALVPLEHDAPTLSAGLTGRAAPLIVISGLAGAATLWLLVVRRFAVARLTALVAVASVVCGWGVGQYPWLLVDQVRIDAAAGASSTLQALLVAVGRPPSMVLPALGYLYWLTQSERWTEHD